MRFTREFSSVSLPTRNISDAHWLQRHFTLLVPGDLKSQDTYNFITEWVVYKGKMLCVNKYHK